MTQCVALSKGRKDPAFFPSCHVIVVHFICYISGLFRSDRVGETVAYRRREGVGLVGWLEGFKGITGVEERESLISGMLNPEAEEGVLGEFFFLHEDIPLSQKTFSLAHNFITCMSEISFLRPRQPFISGKLTDEERVQQDAKFLGINKEKL